MAFPFHHNHRRDDDDEGEPRYPPPGTRPAYSDLPPPLVTHVQHTHYGEAPPLVPHVQHTHYGDAPPPPPSYVAHHSNFPPENPVPDFGRVPHTHYDEAPPPPSYVVHHSNFPPQQPVPDFGYSSGMPPPAVHHHSHHSQHPNFSSVIHKHSHQSDSFLSNRPTVKVFSKANPSFSLAIRDGKVILAPSDPYDPAQHWFKDEKYSTRIKDEEGCPCFALVNKATGQAMKHSIGATHPVQLIPYDPDVVDESVLWTQSKEFGEGYRAIRMVNNIHLNVDAFHGDKYSGGVHDGTHIVLWNWNQGDNQLWKIIPYFMGFEDDLLSAERADRYIHAIARSHRSSDIDVVDNPIGGTTFIRPTPGVYPCISNSSNPDSNPCNASPSDDRLLHERPFQRPQLKGSSSRASSQPHPSFNALPSVYSTLHINGGNCHIDGRESEVLSNAFAAWPGLSESQYPIAKNSSPACFVSNGPWSYHGAYLHLIAVVQKLSYELEHVQRSTIPRSTYDHLWGAHTQALQALEVVNQSISLVKAELKGESNRSRELEKQLSDATQKWQDVEQLTRAFKASDAYSEWAIRVFKTAMNWTEMMISERYPNIDLGFIQAEFQASCKPLITLATTSIPPNIPDYDMSFGSLLDSLPVNRGANIGEDVDSSYSYDDI